MSISHQIYNINGFNLLLIKNNIDNIIVKSYIDTGYIHEDKTNLGINHLIEHVLINGNSQCDNDCITDMNKKGILMNASTGLNMINYFTMGISSDLEKMIKFIVETTINYKNINNKIIEKEKKAVLNELLTNGNNSLISVYHTLFDKLYNYYGLNNFYNYKQQIDNLNNLNEENLKNFYLKYYKNILFIVTGNFEDNIVLTLFHNLLKNNKIDNFAVETTINHCFKFKKGAYFLPNNNIKNTTIIIAFPCIIENSIKNSILLDICSKYIKNICMDKLRAKENLIYGIDVLPSMNYCGTTIQVTLNISNENAKKTLERFVKLIKDSFNSIDHTFVEGIKKNFTFAINRNNIEEKTLFYENMYINKLFNRCKDQICDNNEYSNIYLNIKNSDIKRILPVLFNFDKMVLVYTSQKSMT
jgi:predicted Zn-dependent peptidase